MIHEHRGSAVTAEGIAQWRELIAEAVRQPDLLFCRVVRSGAEIVGFLCGRRDEVVTLGRMYLLNEAQGQGAGGRLMGEFLAWARDAPMRLWVTDYNERASASTSGTDSGPLVNVSSDEASCPTCVWLVSPRWATRSPKTARESDRFI